MKKRIVAPPLDGECSFVFLGACSRHGFADDVKSGESTVPMPFVKSPAIWEADGVEKRAAVQSMFSEIAPVYDRANDLMSMGRHRHWRKLAVEMLGLKTGDAVLDVCCGTGDFAWPLRGAVGPNGRVLGVDFCRPMLEKASAKSAPCELAVGDACRLPIGPEKVEAVTVGWGIRNVPDIDAAHREAFRVLKKGGRFVSIDMAQAQNAPMRFLSGLYVQGIVPVLGVILRNRKAYKYLPKSTLRFWSREKLSQSMRSAGFGSVSTRNLMFGTICVHMGVKP